MLSIVLLGLCIAIKPAFPQTGIVWGNPQVVRQAAHAITAPRVKILADGTVLAIWGESSNPGKIWCSRLKNGQFDAPVSVVTTTPGPALFGFGGFDVAVRGQAIFVVFERSGSGIFLARSDDGGLTFLPPVRVQGAVSGGYVTLANIATDEAGNLFVNYIQEKSGTATQQMRRSTDNGQTFSAAVDAGQPAPGTKVCECCIASPVASKGSVWLAFRNNNANIRDHWVSRSTNLADTFDLAADIDDSDWLINVCPISAPRITLSGDSLIVVWKTGAGGGSKVFASSVHGATLLPGQQIRLGDTASVSENQNLPDIVSEGDTIGVVFQEDQYLAFHFTTNGLAGLKANYSRLKATAELMSNPSLAFRNGVFHLVYTNTTKKEIIYRRAELSKVLGTTLFGLHPEAISIFPNPASSEIQVSLRGICGASGWRILSAVGETLLSGEFSGALDTARIQIAQLPSGLYFFHFTTEQGYSLQKRIYKI